MRVRALSAFSAYRGDTCQMIEAAKGDEITGNEAAYLVATGCPVEIIEADPAPAEPDEDESHRPPAESGDVEAPPPAPVFEPREHNAAQVLAYAKEHPESVGALIAAETGEGAKNRHTLLTELERLREQHAARI